MIIAITREVSPSIKRCELTHLARQPIDFDLATVQHHQYESCLADLGCLIHRLPAEPELPDAVFVEDTAIVLDNLAIVTRPGAESRRSEIPSVLEALREYRRLYQVEPPGTLDGGDVLHVGNVLYVGVSSRSNRAGIKQLGGYVEPYGYKVQPVPLHDCLHLKSAVTQVGMDRLLINRAWVDTGEFVGMEMIDVAQEEPMGANALMIGEVVIYPSAYERTRARLEAHDITVKAVDVTELAKAEGGVTCCSLILNV
jgi:dimethylargininase